MVRFTSAVGLISGLFTVEAFRARKKSCGAKGLSAQIVNGDDASECEWKWQVSLKRGSSFFCGGMIVDDEWVLTAAHCMGNTEFEVLAGEHNLRKESGNEQYRNSKEVYVHPLYDRGTTNFDYALVKVDAPFDLTKGCVGKVCLPADETDDVTGGEECYITGWGTLRSGGSQPDILQEAKVTILSNAACRKTGYSASQITDVMLCAQGKATNGSITDACQGDSGGPLVCQTGGTWSIYGATSWGRGCAGANFPGVWARVAKVLPWIDDVMSGNAPPPPPPPACRRRLLCLR